VSSQLHDDVAQVCRSGLNANRRIWLTRHGESEFNRLGLVGGDAPLTDKGRAYARRLAAALCKLVPVPDEEKEDLPVSCWTSTLRRTIQTAKHVPFPTLRWKALDEIQAGICDGHSYEQIKEKWPETYAARKADKLNFRYPAGESYMDVVKRLESVIIEVERENESVCIIGHQAILRVLYSYFMHVPRSEVRDSHRCEVL
jgi:6-phosphofructo-2-kinase / fructose-2,6-biphosphatase 3